jgi:predicted nucleic acid-binding protein
VSLRAELRRWEGFVSSALLGVEAVRACARYGPEYAAAARDALGTLALLAIDDHLLTRAASLAPPALRALDAIHLATAVRLGAELGALFTYDRRMHEEAERLALPVVVPA